MMVSFMWNNIEANKFAAEYHAEKFRRKELRKRLNIILTIAIPLLLIIGFEVVGYYWGN